MDSETQTQEELDEIWSEKLMDWESDPEDFGIPPALVEACQNLTRNIIQKAVMAGKNIPLNTMQLWPSESTSNQLMKEALELSPEYKDSIPTEENRREFLNGISEQVWEKICEEISENGIQEIESEVETSFITQELTKVIKLEQFYTSLVPLGILYWERASSELKELVSNSSLIHITENPKLFMTKEEIPRKREIPDWIRGIIIAHAIQGNSGSRIILNPKARTKPEPQTFRQAAIWALGPHLLQKGKELYLEEAVEQYQGLNKKRKASQLDIKRIPLDQITPEIEIHPPKGISGVPYPWFLCWGFAPNTDIEVRELADTWKEQRKNQGNILSQYHYRFLQRTLWFLCRLMILQTYEDRATSRENWLIKTAIKEPILNYLKERVPKENNLLFHIIYTECVWKQLCPLAKG